MVGINEAAVGTRVSLQDRIVSNNQLFSEAYLRDLRAAARTTPSPAVAASHQTIAEWHAEFPDFGLGNSRTQYVGYCLSALGLAYMPREDGFTLVADNANTQAVGLCLVVADDELGSTTKGRHHQGRLIRELRAGSLGWGIVTNGTLWRLCSASNAAPYEVWLEVNLDSLLASDPREFTIFHRFFSREAFAQEFDPTFDAMRAGLDRYQAESEQRTDAIQRYLRGKVESVLQALCLGFVRDAPEGSLKRVDLDEVYRNAIYLLYRALFLFYAEARGLMPMTDARYRRVSLASILEDARHRQQEGVQSTYPYSLWKRFAHLCVIVDEGDNELGVYAYNGGLFSDEEKPYLKAHKISDVYFAPPLFELGYMPQGKNGHQRIDYQDLSVRILGTLYEGLLEYNLNLIEKEPVVVRENGGKRTFVPMSQAGIVRRAETVLDVGQVYFADDKGERKASGSYYTPEDVVQYMVANTVTPKVKERCAAIDQLVERVHSEGAVAITEAERERIERYADDEILTAIQDDILSLRILDPAMGSAHFLVAAGQVVTNAIVEVLNRTDWPNDSIDTDPLIWKRRVVERCLYGVDLNPLAQELAKLSLWLSSASVGKPLTFLDHHLKVGNSLYGAPLARLSNLPSAKKPPANDMFRAIREETIRTVLADVARITSMDSERIEDVKQKGELNRTAAQFTQRLRDLANVWLASLFGLPVGDADYFNFVQDVTRNYAPEAWEDRVEKSVELLTAREIAERERFFHWELEFPDAIVQGACVFDAIIANPPYVGTAPTRPVLSLYDTAKAGDLYAWMIERALGLVADTSTVGMIVPMSLTFARDKKAVRRLLLERHMDIRIASFDNNPDSIFQASGAVRNSQRTSIIYARGSTGETKLFATDLLRWGREERPKLFSRVCFAEITKFATQENFPKAGNEKLAAFWYAMSASKRQIRDISLAVYSETRRPPTSALFLTVPRAVRYFISATPGPLNRNKVLSVSFRTAEHLQLAQVLVNSNIFYWYWLAFGDGFLLGTDVLSAFPVPDVVDEHFHTLAAELARAMPECVTYHPKLGDMIPNYNFNKRMDILLEIDDWILQQVAPDLELPRDIFAQYKSNSFLRPLDLAALLQAENALAEEVES